MRYWIDTNTLFVRGSFRAASTGINGGIRSVSTLFNHTVPKDWADNDPGRELEHIAAAAGTGPDFFGLLTAVPMDNLCVLQFDFVTVFITAGIREESPDGPGTINIIVYSSRGLTDSALLEAVMVATEAKSEALLGMGRTVTGTPTDAVIAACNTASETKDTYAGRITDTGSRIRAAVLQGIPHALTRYEEGSIHNHTAFFIFSRFKGEHWVEWTPDNCPYYPCHFPGQRCDFCYCPFYPCGNEQLGQWSESTNGSKVWNCSGCTLLHEPEIADYLNKYPEASLSELMQRKTDKKNDN
jgi:adenosylcobinamide hydrolase